MNWLHQLVGSEMLYRTVIAGVIVVVFWLFSRAVRSILKWFGRKVFARTETTLDDRVLGVVLAHVKPLMILTGLHIAIREIRKGATVSDETIHQILDYGLSILYVIVVVLVVKIVLGVVRVFVDWYLDKVSEDGSTELKLTLGPLTSKVVNILVGMVAIIIVLDHFGVNIGSLLVSLGVGSLAVALAAQDTLANMIAGFVILVDRPFRVGDRIELPSGHIGDVHSIGLRSTRIVNFDNNLIIVPNGELIKSRIVNYAYPFSEMRVLLKVNVAYGTDPETVRRILMELSGKHPDILKDPAPSVQMTAWNDSSVEFSLITRTADFIKSAPATNDLREQAYQRFAQEGIEIPFPQRVIQMKTSS